MILPGCWWRWPRNAARRSKVYEPDDGARAGGATRNWRKAIGAAMGRKRDSCFAPHSAARCAGRQCHADRMLRGDKAKLTADRVGYMCHPDWVGSTASRRPNCGAAASRRDGA
jgi:hypothetical protein